MSSPKAGWVLDDAVGLVEQGYTAERMTGWAAPHVLAHNGVLWGLDELDRRLAGPDDARSPLEEVRPQRGQVHRPSDEVADVRPYPHDT